MSQFSIDVGPVVRMGTNVETEEAVSIFPKQSHTLDSERHGDVQFLSVSVNQEQDKVIREEKLVGNESALSFTAAETIVAPELLDENGGKDLLEVTNGSVRYPAGGDDDIVPVDDEINGVVSLPLHGHGTVLLGSTAELEAVSNRDEGNGLDLVDDQQISGDLPEPLGEDVEGLLLRTMSTVEAGGNIEIPEVAAEQKQLSKSAMKQLAKRERYKELKVQKKAFEKEKKHEQTAKRRKEWEEKLATLTEEEKEKTRIEQLNTRMERRQEQLSRKEKLRQAMESGQNLVVDLDFSQLMKPNELTSLIQQVMYSYSANGRAMVPARISFTGVRGVVKQELEKISGFGSWLVHKEERSYQEVFEERQADLVYLTPDSENTLGTLSPSKIYIIGGLVDRNRWKNVTLDKAKEQGIATAKLPIGDHLKMLASKVLTVNQVVELLLSFLQVGDWKAALEKVVPVRKRAAEEVSNESVDTPE